MRLWKLLLPEGLAHPIRSRRACNMPVYRAILKSLVWFTCVVGRESSEL